MSVSATNPMADLFRRLRAVGLTAPYIRKTILPEWWDDQAAENPAGYTEGLVFLSRHLGLDLACLYRDTALRAAFGSGMQTTESNAVACLQAYINELRQLPLDLLAEI